MRARIEATGRDIWLEVDGGVKVDNIAEIARAGADTFVAGSAIFGTKDYKATIARHARGALGRRRMSGRFRAVLLDLDGTLLHTAPDLAAAANSMLGELGFAPRAPEELAAFIGKGLPALVHRALAGTLDGRRAGALRAGAADLRALLRGGVGSARRAVSRRRRRPERMQALRLPLGCVTNKAGRFTRTSSSASTSGDSSTAW